MASTAADSQTRQVAERFVEARRSGAALPDYPGELPRTLADGYAIQDQALLLVDDEVAGWKVGKIAPPIDGVDRLAGPIFAGSVVAGQDAPVAMPVFADGFAAAEAEFLLRLAAAPDPAKTSYTMDEAAALIDAVHVGIEVASSPFPGINTHGAPVTVSDFGNNNGLVVGSPLQGWPGVDLNAVPVALLINGAVVGEATAATMLDGPIGAARFLFEALARRGVSLHAGQWVSSGAVTGVHPCAVGDEVEARFGDGQAVTCRITKA